MLHLRKLRFSMTEEQPSLTFLNVCKMLRTLGDAYPTTTRFDWSQGIDWKTVKQLTNNQLTIFYNPTTITTITTLPSPHKFSFQTEPSLSISSFPQTGTSFLILSTSSSQASIAALRCLDEVNTKRQISPTFTSPRLW